MLTITFITALAALIIGIMAYSRAGGVRDLRSQMESLRSTTDSMREKTADALDKLEKFVRGSKEPAPPEEKKEEKE